MDFVEKVSRLVDTLSHFCDLSCVEIAGSE